MSYRPSTSTIGKSDEIEKGCAAERDVVPLAPAVPPAERDAGRRPAIQVQGIGVLGRHIAQASPVFGAEAGEGGLWRDIGRSGRETSPHGGMKPPLQPFAFAAGLHGSPLDGASLIAGLWRAYSALSGRSYKICPLHEAPFLHKSDKKYRCVSMRC